MALHKFPANHQTKAFTSTPTVLLIKSQRYDSTVISYAHNHCCFVAAVTPKHMLLKLLQLNFRLGTSICSKANINQNKNYEGKGKAHK